MEAAASPGAGALAWSAMLAAFAIDRVIELVNGAIMLWKLSIEAQVHCLIRHLP
ncbi:MAG TPA: hypothetical protein VKV40_09440 [Ktedonobacteraceae bacterium]|nr:hypothetical protein [Ktedonobacteraceae bacterium]